MNYVKASCFEDIVKLSTNMGGSSSKEVNLTKSIPEKENEALRNAFEYMVKGDPGKEAKPPCIKQPKNLNAIFSDYDQFLEKLHAWMVYCKENNTGDDISKKYFSKEGLCSNAFLLGMEVLTNCTTSSIYYKEYENQDYFKVLLYILKANSVDPHKYFKSNSIRDLDNVNFKEIENAFNLVFNFLNKTSGETYSPFSFLKPIFEYDNKDSGEDVEKWQMTYSSFRIQLKRTIPFTTKFCGKYIESQSMYNKKFAQSKSGEQLWSDSSLNFKTVQMPQLSKEILDKTGIMTNEIWSTLFLAMPRLELAKGVDMIYNSSSDGLSFNRLSNHIIGYKGPMIMLIKHKKKRSFEEDDDKPLADDCILGAFIDDEIKDNGKFGGGVQCCIFSVSPELRVMRTINNKGGTNYVYLNTAKIENSSYAYGLGFGGSTNEFRMCLDGDNIVENSYVNPDDRTYEVGYLLTNSHGNKMLNINRIEIYGLGGIEALEAQEEHRRKLQSLRDKKKQVDKKQFLDSDFDKEFLLGNTYSHKREMKDREES